MYEKLPKKIIKLNSNGITYLLIVGYYDRVNTSTHSQKNYEKIITFAKIAIFCY